MAKLILVNSIDTINNRWGKEFHNLSKVNLITWLEFERAYFEAAIQHFSHYGDLIVVLIKYRLKSTLSELSSSFLNNGHWLYNLYCILLPPRVFSIDKLIFQ